MRRVLRSALSSMAFACLAVVVGVAVSQAAPGHSSKSKAPALVLLDARGKPEGTLMAQTGLFPGMAARATTLTVMNRGTKKARFMITTSATAASGQGSILDLLQATVTDVTSRNILYRGPLSRIVASDPLTLSPRQSRRLTILLTWPDHGTIDDRFRGAFASFKFALAYKLT